MSQGTEFPGWPISLLDYVNLKSHFVIIRDWTYDESPFNVETDEQQTVYRMSLRDWFHIGTKKDNTSQALGKKYELVLDQQHFIGRKPPGIAQVCRIRALRDFGDVKAGDLGGYVESERNLSQDGNCWVYNEAEIWGNALIYGDATVRNSARVYQEARIGGKVRVSASAHVSGHYKANGREKLHGGRWMAIGFNCPPGCCRQ